MNNNKQNEVEKKRAAKLMIANKEKDKLAEELVVANKEIAFQNKEEDKLADELVIANKELAFQNKEKDKRAAELITANKELLIQKKNVEEKVKEISESQMATIFALAKLAESRDDDTGAHLLRVSLFCRLLAEELAMQPEYKDEMNEDFINHIALASPLHDIGKVGIRDSILLKPGKLLPGEFEEMKTHAEIGARTLAEVYENYPDNNFIKTGMEIAMSHHEKWNGSGYPEGLKGDSIPISARIMAMADVYDALRTKRAYKEAYSHEKTIEIIMEEEKEHFDPLIVKAFIEKQEEFNRGYNQLVEG